MTHRTRDAGRRGFLLTVAGRDPRRQPRAIEPRRFGHRNNPFTLTYEGAIMKNELGERR